MSVTVTFPVTAILCAAVVETSRKHLWKTETLRQIKMKPSSESGVFACGARNNIIILTDNHPRVALAALTLTLACAFLCSVTEQQPETSRKHLWKTETLRQIKMKPSSESGVFACGARNNIVIFSDNHPRVALAALTLTLACAFLCSVTEQQPEFVCHPTTHSHIL